MKRFKLVNLVLTVILFTLIVASPVLAATYDYALAFAVKDTGGTARTYVPVLTGIGYTGLNTAGYATSATGVVIYNGATAVTAMVGTTQTAIVLPSLPASNTVGLNLYTDYSVPWATQPIVTGTGGYVTTADAAALEPGNSFTSTFRGYVDTSAGASKDLVFKDLAIRTYVSGASTITATASSSAATSISQLTSDTAVTTNTAGITSVVNLYNGTNTRAGQILNGVPACILTAFSTTLSKTGSPTGTIYFRVRKSSDDSIVATPTTWDAATVGSPIAFTGTQYLPADNYRFCIEYSGGDAGNYITLWYNNADTTLGSYFYYVGGYTDRAGEDFGTLSYTIGMTPVFTGSNVRVGQRVDTVPACTLTQFQMYLVKTGTPTGTGYFRVRKVSDDSLVATLSSIDVSTIGAGNWYGFTGTQALAADNYRFTFEYAGGSATAYIRAFHKLSHTVTGNQCYYVAAWTDNATYDSQVQISYFVLTTATANATPVTSGIRKVVTTLAGGTLTLSVYNESDVLIDDGTAAFAGSVYDNANNFIWARGNVAPYLDYIKYAVGGTQVVWYEPNAVITGTTLPDREGAAQNGVITFGANSNITVTMGAVTSYASVAGTSPGAGVAPTFQDANMPTGWFATGSGATLPFYDSFNTAATGLGISTQSLYIMMMMAVALAVGLMAGIMTGSWLIGTLGIGVMILAGVNTGVIPVWMLFVYAVMGGGVLYLSKQV